MSSKQCVSKNANRMRKSFEGKHGSREKMRVRVTDELDCLSCFIMAWYVCWEGGRGDRQPDKSVEPQSISGHSSFSLSLAFRGCRKFEFCIVFFCASFPPLKRNEGLSTAADCQQLKQPEFGGLLTRLFHKKGKGAWVKQVVAGGGRRGANRRHREQKQQSVRFPQGRPFTAEWRRHDLPGSKEASQQTFLQRFGIWPHNRSLF